MGRLCAVASCHMLHLSWPSDGNWGSALNMLEIDEKEAQLGLQVCYALTAV